MHEGVQSTRLGSARNSVGFGRRDGGARHPARRADRRALSRGASLDEARGGDGGVRQEPQGLPVTCEVTPHHFSHHRRGHEALRRELQDEAAARGRAATSTRRSTGIADGTVDALATDHAPHPGSEKMQEFEKCPFGILGLETALGLTFEKLVHPGQDLADEDGRAVHDGSSERAAAEPRHAGSRSAGRCHGVRPGAPMDV